MLNKFIGIGRWTKDIELRYAPSGKAVANGTIAIDDGYGERKQTAFLPVVMWEKLAENVANYSGKGRLVAIEGRVTTRSYDNNEGRKVFVTEILAHSVQFLDRGNEQQAQRDPFMDSGKPIDLTDDSLPF